MGYLPQCMQILFKHIVNVKITEFFFNFSSTSQFDLNTFQMLNSHTWPMATTLDGTSPQCPYNGDGRPWHQSKNVTLFTWEFSYTDLYCSKRLRQTSPVTYSKSILLAFLVVELQFVWGNTMFKWVATCPHSRCRSVRSGDLVWSTRHGSAEALVGTSWKP